MNAVTPPTPSTEPPAPRSVLEDADWRAELARVRHAWRTGRNPDARAYLDAHPHLAEDFRAVLDLAYEEYLQRREAGEAMDREEFCARFPLCRVELRKTLEAQSMLQGNPDLLDLVEPIRWPEPGETICGYVLRCELGRGSFGRVFLASQPRLGNRTVVVKVTADGESEAQTLGPLHHPNIIGVHHLEHDDKRRLSVVCMPYEGEVTLETVMHRLQAGTSRPVLAQELLAAAQPVGTTPSPSRECLPVPSGTGSFSQAVAQLGAELAEALEYLHQQGIYHRDLKPANVLVTPAGRPLLLDFNLADGKDPKRWKVAGTIPYMAPEQIRAMAKARSPALVAPSPAQDLFSLGVLLYELLTGEHPFGPPPDTETAAEWRTRLLKQQERGPVPLRSRRADVDQTLAQVVEHCLRYVPEDRPASAGQVAAALRRLNPPGSPPRRSSLLMTAVTGVLVLVASTIAGMNWLQTDQSSPEPARPDIQTELDSGLAAYAASQYPAAISHWTTVLHHTTEPTTRAWAHYGRGRALQLQGDYAAALGDYIQAFELIPDWRFRAGMGYCRNKMGSHSEAVTDYTWVIEQGVRNAAVFNNRGFSLLYSAGKSSYSLAGSDLAQSMGLAPELPAIQANRIRVQLYQLVAYPRTGVSWDPRELWAILTSGPSDPYVAFDGLLICMMAANRQRTRSDREPWIELGLRCAERAVLDGLDPRSLQEGSVVKHLGADPRFSRLVELASTSSCGLRTRNWATYLCDPSPDPEGQISPPLASTTIPAVPENSRTAQWTVPAR